MKTERSNPAGAVEAPLARLFAIVYQWRRATDQHRSLLVLMFAMFVPLRIHAADGGLEPGWSAVAVRVIEHETGRPVAGARIETTCNGSRYVAERPTTDENGRATVPIYRTWVGLRVTHSGFTNTIVTLVGTNEVTAFCRNAVIKLGRAAK